MDLRSFGAYLGEDAGWGGGVAAAHQVGDYESAGAGDAFFAMDEDGAALGGGEVVGAGVGVGVLGWESESPGFRWKFL